jgi:cytochrome c2
MEIQKPHLVSDLISGRKVFEAKNCNQCHSIFERERKIGPKLKSSRFYGSFLDIFSLLWNHAPAMAVHMRREVLERPTLSTTELNELISFLYMLPYLGQPGDARHGEALLESKSCFKCHSLGKKGRRDGPPLDSLAVYQSPVVMLQRMWNHGPEMIGRMTTTGTSIPTFSGNEMADIFAALTKETPSKGKKNIPRSRECGKRRETVYRQRLHQMPLDFWKGRQAGPGPWEDCRPVECDNANHPDLEPYRTDEATI